MSTQLQIINDSVDRILKNGRCISHYGSEYKHGERTCPVGFYLLDPSRAPRRKIQSWNANYDKFFKEEVRGLSQEFWQDLQNLHDWDFVWFREMGITYMTPKGKRWLEKLKMKWGPNVS